MLRKLCLLSSLLLAFAVATLAQESRHFIFHYDFTVKNLPPGKKIRIWIPAAQSDAYQEVKVVSLHGSMPLERARGKKVQIWLPAARSDAYQEVRVVSAKGDLPLKKTRESKHGNEIYYAETAGTNQPELPKPVARAGFRMISACLR